MRSESPRTMLAAWSPADLERDVLGLRRRPHALEGGLRDGQAGRWARADSCTLPVMMREWSSRSAMRRLCALTPRSIAASARARVAVVEVSLAAGQDVDPARDDGQRPAQLVGDGGHELVLEMVGGLGPLAGRVLQGEDRRRAPAPRACCPCGPRWRGGAARCPPSPCSRRRALMRHRPPAEPRETRAPPRSLRTAVRGQHRRPVPSRRLTGRPTGRCPARQQALALRLLGRTRKVS